MALTPLVVPGGVLSPEVVYRADPADTGGARLTERLRCAAGRRVRDAGSTIVQAARDFGLSWPVLMDAFRTAAATVIEAELPEVSVLGIDETRRGRTRWEQDPDTGKWQLTRDRWHTGFVDALSTGGLLGQVEGRTVADIRPGCPPRP